MWTTHILIKSGRAGFMDIDEEDFTTQEKPTLAQIHAFEREAEARIFGPIRRTTWTLYQETPKAEEQSELQEVAQTAQ